MGNLVPVPCATLRHAAPTARPCNYRKTLSCVTLAAVPTVPAMTSIALPDYPPCPSWCRRHDGSLGDLTHLLPGDVEVSMREHLHRDPDLGVVVCRDEPQVHGERLRGDGVTLAEARDLAVALLAACDACDGATR